MADTPRNLPEGDIRLLPPKDPPSPSVVPMGDAEYDNLLILKKWMGGQLPAGILRHVTESGMLRPSEMRHTMREFVPRGGWEAWEGQMPTTESVRPKDQIIYEGKSYPGYLEKTSNAGPPPGPFAETDDATLQSLSQSLEGTLRDEILKELEMRAQRQAGQTLGMQ